MLKVKVCGIRRPEDVEIVNRYLPEYTGFIFAPSKRRIGAEDARNLIGKLNRKIKTVGVFVNENISAVMDMVEKCGLDVVQVHGDEKPDYIHDLRVRLLSHIKEEQKKISVRCRKVELWKAVRVRDAQSIQILKGYNVDAYLLDAYADDCYGGSGRTFDWNLAVEAGKCGRVVLAGGLNADNVYSAIRMSYPFAVDVSSGVETDGCKDEVKIRDFISRVRNYE